MTLRQLEKLSKNPNYVLSQEQIDMLNKHRASTFKDYKARNVFQKHKTDLEDEDDG